MDRERNFKFNDSILRHLVVRQNKAFTEESQFAKAKAEEERLEEEKKKSAESRAAAAKETEDEAPPEEAVEEVAEPQPEGEESIEDTKETE